MKQACSKHKVGMQQQPKQLVGGQACSMHLAGLQHVLKITRPTSVEARVEYEGANVSG